jgi:hypothetical protein
MFTILFVYAHMLGRYARVVKKMGARKRAYDVDLTDILPEDLAEEVCVIALDL